MRAIDTITAVKTAESVANSQVVWSILFILMTGYLLWIQRQDKMEAKSDKKENLEIQKSFTEALNKQTDAMKDISASLNETNKSVVETNKSLQNLEHRMDGIERNSYMKNIREYNGKGGG